MNFPMWLISVENFLALNEIEPHQVLKRKGQLVALHDSELAQSGPVFFLSHQWTSFTQPNPGNEQLKSMQNLLTSMSNGTCPSVGPKSK